MSVKITSEIGECLLQGETQQNIWCTWLAAHGGISVSYVAGYAEDESREMRRGNLRPLFVNLFGKHFCGL